MRKRKIANKLFGLISFSLIGLLGLQLVFQSLYLEKFYAYSKQQRITKELVNLSKRLGNQESKEINDELLRFSQEMEAATAIMDLSGIPIYGLETQRPFMEVRSEENRLYRIYLDGYVINEEVMGYLRVGKSVSIAGVESQSEEYYEVHPSEIKILNQDKAYEVGMEAQVIEESKPLVKDEVTEKIQSILVAENTASLSSSMASTAQTIYTYPAKIITNLKGTIETIYVPDENTYGNGYREYKILEETSSFLIDIVKEQKTLTTYEPIIYEKLDTYIGVKHIVGIIPMMIKSQPMLLVSMISLQGVEEAVGIMNHYALLIFIGVLGLALMIAYGYAKRLTKPLVELRNITTDIANLDFSHNCEVTSQDEIGELAENINKMSQRLKTNLETMQKDIDLKNQLDQQRKQLIADVSHELKTPLTVMKGTCCGLVDGIYDSQDNKVFEGMLTQINQMSDLVQELLEVSRLENEVQLEEEVFVLSDVILKVHRQLKLLIQEKSLKVTLDLEEYLAKGDRKKIETVIRNLYNNAIFYTPSNESIHLQIRQEEEMIKVIITNYGVSIPEELQERLWEPFYRIDQSRNKTLGGSGLGLYMVKQILEKHGSRYGLDSQEDHVTFWFELPFIENNE